MVERRGRSAVKTGFERQWNEEKYRRQPSVDYCTLQPSSAAMWNKINKGGRGAVYAHWQKNGCSSAEI
jgi:hypothetical protein